MIPGEIFPAEGSLTLNAGAQAITLIVANTGDRPVQVGSHYHFAETNPALDFDRDAARGLRLDIASGTAVRFEPGQRREVQLIPIGGARRVFGFNQHVMGPLCLAFGLFVAGLSPSTSQAETSHCPGSADTQSMNKCAKEQYLDAEAVLKVTFRNVMEALPEVEHQENLLEAQRLWVSYRDAACWVGRRPKGAGTMHTLSSLGCLKSATVSRTQLLLDYRGL